MYGYPVISSYIIWNRLTDGTEQPFCLRICHVVNHALDDKHTTRSASLKDQIITSKLDNFHPVVCT